MIWGDSRPAPGHRQIAAEKVREWKERRRVLGHLTEEAERELDELLDWLENGR